MELITTGGPGTSIIFVYLIGGLICWGIAAFLTEPYKGRRGLRGLLVGWAIGLGFFVLGAGIMSLISWNVSVNSKGDRTATIGEQLNEFGFTSGETYPLILGSRVSGSSGEGSLGRSFLGFTGNMTVRPSTAVTVSFQNGNESYLLEPMTSNIKFIQSTDTKPSIELYVHNENTHSKNLAGKDGTSTTFTYSDCDVVFYDFLIQCIKPVESTTITLDEDVQRRGLGPIMAENFDSAVITLTPEMYQELMDQN